MASPHAQIATPSPAGPAAGPVKEEFLRYLWTRACRRTQMVRFFESETSGDMFGFRLRNEISAPFRRMEEGGRRISLTQQTNVIQLSAEQVGFNIV